MTISWLLNLTAAIAVVLTLRIVASAGNRLRPTTLLTPWKWALGAALAWAVAILFSAMPGEPDASHAVGEHLWYASGVLSVCPPIAVLGARRPRAKAWTWFVLLPLMAVLGWPAVTAWAIAPRQVALQLETPHLMGWLLVLVMGAGNYVGTKHCGAACLYAAAMMLLIAPLSAASPVWLSGSMARASASILVSIAVLAARWQNGRHRHPQPSLNRLVEDYRDWYGIVWGRRLQDRLNEVARQRGWPVVLTPGGFVWEDGVSDEQHRDTTANLEQSLRWMLRPFVDPEWIDRRLKTS